MNDSSEEWWTAFLLCDSSFPGGTLAHSQGLESSMMHHYVDGGNINNFIKYALLVLEQARYLSFPFLRTAWSTACDDTMEISKKMQVLGQLDQCMGLYLMNDISKAASISQGKGFVRVIWNCFSQESYPLVHALGSNSSLGDLNGVKYHHAPLFGFICADLKISLTLCERMYMRLVLRDLTSAAIRLNILGPLEACQVQIRLFSYINALLESRRTAEEIADSIDEREALRLLFPAVFFHGDEIPQQRAPIIDLLQSRHGLLYSRLFSS